MVFVREDNDLCRGRLIYAVILGNAAEAVVEDRHSATAGKMSL